MRGFLAKRLPSGGRRKWLFATSAAAVAVGMGIFIASAFGVLAGSPSKFEANDGNNIAFVNVSYEAHIPMGATNTNTIVRPTSTSINATVSGDIGGDEWVGAYDIDIFSFTATANEKIAVNLNRTGGNLDSYVRAYDPSFGLVAGNLLRPA